MASSTSNVKLGVCTVSFGGVDLGYTKGGVEVEIATETHRVTVDQFGSAPINEYVTSREVKVRVPLAESTLDNLIKVLPGSTLVTDGVDPTKKKVSVDHAIGTNLLALAAELKLHPVANLAANKLEDFTIPKAMTPGTFTFAYKLDEERVFNVEFNGYPDNAGLLFVVGDTTAAP